MIFGEHNHLLYNEDGTIKEGNVKFILESKYELQHNLMLFCLLHFEGINTTAALKILSFMLCFN